jgi:hypothetical protein
MKLNIIVVFCSLFIIACVAINLMCADLSPQHAEFLKTFFWDFPCMVIERLIPGFGS